MDTKSVVLSICATPEMQHWKMVNEIHKAIGNDKSELANDIKASLCFITAYLGGWIDVVDQIKSKKIQYRCVDSLGRIGLTSFQRYLMEISELYNKYDDGILLKHSVAAKALDNNEIAEAYDNPKLIIAIVSEFNSLQKNYCNEHGYVMEYFIETMRKLA